MLLKRKILAVFSGIFLMGGQLSAGGKPAISILGDSYSTFAGAVPEGNAVWYRPAPDNSNDVCKVEQTWWHQVIQMLGGELEKNESYSGSTVCNTGYNKSDAGKTSFLARASRLGKPRIILVCGATNDSWAGVPMGEYKYKDWTAKELFSFRPGLAKLLAELKQLYPQAEIYFINLAGNVQIKFGIPYFDVFDPRFLDFAVPMAVRGSITFNITDYKAFIKLNRMINFTLEDFKNQVKDAVTKSIKSFVTNAPQNNGIPVLQIERKITEISDLIQERLAKEMREDFGVNLKRIDLADIEVDKESDGYRELRHITAGQQAQTIQAQTDVNIKNLQDTQAINAENVQESLRIQREEAQRAQRLQTETNFIGAHALDQQTSVLKAGAESLGSMSHIGDGGGMNAAGMMTGMVMGGAMGNQMAGMMNNLGQQMQNSMNTPPPPPTPNYMVSMNGQQSGPFNIQQLQQLAQQGQINAQTYVWKQGMSNWVMAGQVQELASLFIASTPPPPPPTL